MADIANTPGTETGNQVIGKVSILYGTVKAISPDGTMRILALNSPVYADDRIITESDGSVSIVLDDPAQTQLDIGRMSDIILDEDVYGGVTPEDVAEAAAEAEQIQQALLAGEEGDLDMEATAAGGVAAAGGGHPTFVVDPTGEEVIAGTPGPETTGTTPGTVDPLPGTPGEPAPPFVEPEPVEPSEPEPIIPTAKPDYAEATEGVEANVQIGNVLDNDASGDGSMVVTSIEIDGSTYGVPGTYSTLLGGQLTINSDGSYEYVPPPQVDHDTNDDGVEDTIQEVFPYTITNDEGNSASSSLTITVADTEPVAVVDEHYQGEAAVTEGEETVYTGNVTNNDIPGADPFEVTGVTGGAVGVATATALGGSIIIYADGSYDYTPPAQVQHTTDDGLIEEDSVEYTIKDSDGDTSSAFLYIDVADTEPSIAPVKGILANEMGNSLTANLNTVFGADVDGATVTLGLLAGTPVYAADGITQLTSGDTGLVWSFDEPTNTWSAVIDGTQNAAFTLELTDQTYTITLSDTYALDGASGAFDVVMGDGIKGGNTLDVALFDVSSRKGFPDTDNNNIPDDADHMIYVNATNESVNPVPDTVNASNQGLGVGKGQDIASEDGNTNTSETLNLWFAEPDVNPKDVDNPATDLNLKPVNYVKLTLDHLDEGENAVWKAYNVDESGNLGAAVGQGVIEGFGTGSGGGSDVFYVIDTVAGNDGGTVTSTFNLLVLTAEEGSDYRVQAITGSGESLGFDTTLSIDATVTDGDGDPSTAAPIVVTFDADGDITGTDAAEVIVGSSGLDIISGGAGDDIIDGGAGDDIIHGGAGADTLDGGAGNDTLSYEGDTAGVVVDLKGDTASGGDAQGDIISNFENVTGGSGDDKLFGNDQANILEGGSGDDTLRGSAGADTLVGGAGDDTLKGGSGADTLTGGADADTFKMVGKGHDTIMDYNRSQGDDINVSGVPGYHHLGANIIESDGGKAKIVLFDSGNNEIGSVTFDNVDFEDIIDTSDLTELLGDDDPEGYDS